MPQIPKEKKSIEICNLFIDIIEFYADLVTVVMLYNDIMIIGSVQKQFITEYAFLFYEKLKFSNDSKCGAF